MATAIYTDRVVHVLALMKAGDDAFNRQDIAAMDAVHHPDIIAHMTGSEKPTGGRAGGAGNGAWRHVPRLPISTSTMICTRSSSVTATG